MIRNQETSIPVYRQLRQLILDQIEQGKLMPGERILTENRLADQFHVSRTTIRRSLKGLENEGLIVRFPKKGTFINSAVRNDRNPQFTVGINFFTGFKTNFYYGEIVDGIMAEAELRNIHIRVLSPDLMQDDPTGLDGLIFAGHPNEESKILRKAAKGILPAVGYNYRLGHAGFIGIDNAAEAKRGVEALIDKGCRRIGFFGSRPDIDRAAANRRYSGYCEALKDHGIELDMDLVHFLDNVRSENEQAADFLRTNGKMDALFVTTAHSLFSVLYAMNIMRISLDDLQLLCFDNLDMLHLDWPGISYIRMPLRQIGERMLDAVRQNLILKERAPIVNDLYQTEIITDK